MMAVPTRSDFTEVHKSEYIEEGYIFEDENEAACNVSRDALAKKVRLNSSPKSGWAREENRLRDGIREYGERRVDVSFIVVENLGF